MSHMNSPVKLPNQYEFIGIVGEGSFGKVLKCWSNVTLNIVAVKVNKCNEGNDKEISILRNLMRHNFDQCNIVKFFGSIPVENHGKGVVFEMLDISLHNYMVKNRFAPMPLSDIRDIIQQMATALDALKSIGVIHTDIKPDNIMLVDQTRRPLVAKLIDFGLALHRQEATLGKKLSPVPYRSPEVILGLPLSEATDMWSLACVMINMLTGLRVSLAKTEYEVIQFIVSFLGQPADHLLDKGLKTSIYFSRTESNSWRLKAAVKYKGIRGHMFRLKPLDFLKMYLRMANKGPAEEQEQWIELLRAMMTFDTTKRITPSEVLAHPFIDNNEASTSATAQSSMNWDMSQLEQAMGKTAKETTASLRIPSRPPMVHPVTASEGPRVDSHRHRGTSVHPPATAPKDDDTTNIQPDHCGSSPTIPKSVVISVQPVTAENTRMLGDQETADSLRPRMTKMIRMPAMASEDEYFDCEPPASALKDDDTTNIQPDHCASSPTIPKSVVINVQPITAKNTQMLGDQESADSLQAWQNKMIRMPAMASEDEYFDCEPPASALKDNDTTNIKPDHWIPKPIVINVQLATQTMADKNSAESEERRGEESEDVRDSITCDDIRSKEKKKKKKRFRRFCSWMKKTFCCCWTCPNED